GKFSIIAEDADCNDTISWLVVAERADEFIKASGTTDGQGHLIPEVVKSAPTQSELADLQDQVRFVESEEAAADKEIEEEVRSVPLPARSIARAVRRKRAR